MTRGTYTHDLRHGSYGAEASGALGVAPGRVLKTLAADVDGRLAVGVVPPESACGGSPRR